MDLNKHMLRGDWCIQHTAFIPSWFLFKLYDV